MGLAEDTPRVAVFLHELRLQLPVGPLFCDRRCAHPRARALTSPTKPECADACPHQLRHRQAGAWSHPERIER